MYVTQTVRALSLGLALSTVVVVSTAAAWHLDLTDSFPKADQVLAEPPDTIRLWFNQVPELSLAAISLEGADGTIEVGKPKETDDPRSFKADVLGHMGAGAYQVVWRASGSDGHVIRGRYGFEVRGGHGSAH